MKRTLIPVLVLALLLAAGDSLAQSRRGQIELFGGAAFPLGPDFFKDYYKVGISGHGQYVFFPNPSVGVVVGAAYEDFTFDGDTFLDDFGAAIGEDLSDWEAEGGARIIELGIGVRPYLTSPEAPTQLFLFGMGTFNLIHEEYTLSYMGDTFSGDDDYNKIGIAAGAGLEIPAGSSLNVILQGLARFIFTEDETTSFIGVTGGVVF